MAQKYSEQQLERLWVQAGGDPKVAPMMAKIAIRESGGRAHINNAGLNKDGSVDYGLWQINSVHGYNPQKLYDPKFNAKAAVSIYKSQGPKAWATYNPAIDRKYIGNVGGGSSPARSDVSSIDTRYGGDNTALALSLLGVSNSYGLDPLQLALTAAFNNQMDKAPKPAGGVSTQSTPSSARGVAYVDGKPVVPWIASILKKARQAGWRGSVTSGVRTKSEQLAAAKRYGLQHYPNGPLASNHVEGHGGAVDVSDPEGLKRALRKLGINRLKSSMPEDPVHFSATGH